jgi:hypothetical protein
MIVVGQDVLDKPGGQDFVCCLIETFYEFNRMLEEKSLRQGLLVDLGKKFSSLNAEDMDTCCKKTRFFNTPDKALGLFTGEKDPLKLFEKPPEAMKKFPDTMDMIVKDYKERKILKDKVPKLGYGGADKAGDADLRFDPTFIEKVKKRQ